MSTPETVEWMPRFDGWIAELAHTPSPRVPKELVHKHRDENVFVARVEPAVEGRTDDLAVQLYIPPDHPYFFEHPLDHVPGIALIEAGRQAGLVVAHRFYGLPLEGYSCFITDLHSSFHTFAELDTPVIGHFYVTDLRMKRGTLVGMTCTGRYGQRGKHIGSVTGVWNIVPTAVMERLRKRTHAQ